MAQRIGLVDSKGKALVDGTGDGVTIAMIDTGVVPVEGLEHSNLVLGPDFTPEDMYGRTFASWNTNGHVPHFCIVGTDDAWAAESAAMPIQPSAST